LLSVFTAGDVDAVLNSKTGYPFIDLFYNATKSFGATNTMCAVIIINLTASSIAVLATASRQLWSFARNKGLPFSNWLAPTVLPRDIPLNALYVSLVITILLSLINIGSSAALQAIFSISTSSLLTSYLITIGSIISWRLRGNQLPKARFTLGRWGLWINMIAICFLLPWLAFSFFPNTPNPTTETMNWGCLMYGTVIIFSTSYYLVWGRHSYSPPSEQVKQMIVNADSFYIGSDKSEAEAEAEAEAETERHQVTVSGEKKVE
jgi:amino acid transporter